MDALELKDTTHLFRDFGAIITSFWWPHKFTALVYQNDSWNHSRLAENIAPDGGPGSDIIVVRLQPLVWNRKMVHSDILQGLEELFSREDLGNGGTGAIGLYNQNHRLLHGILVPPSST